MYSIIDSNNKVVCANDDIVYVSNRKNGTWKLAEKNTATAVYIKGVRYSLNDYYVVETDSIPDDMDVYEYQYDTENNKFSYVKSLDEMKSDKQTENKKAFADFLDSKTITWTDGKQYGVSYDDQTEISLNISQYQAALASGSENPTLEWHAVREECVTWTIEDLSALMVSITEFVYPYLHKMQEYKTAIYSSETPKALTDIRFNYEEV